MKKKQLTRERIFRNNQVVLSNTDRINFAANELARQSKVAHDEEDITLIASIIKVDIYDPFISVGFPKSNRTILQKIFKQRPLKAKYGYSKRMPNDVPNDRIAIQVAVSRLIKRLKND